MRELISRRWVVGGAIGGLALCASAFSVVYGARSGENRLDIETSLIHVGQDEVKTCRAMLSVSQLSENPIKTLVLAVGFTGPGEGAPTVRRLQISHPKPVDKRIYQVGFQSEYPCHEFTDYVQTVAASEDMKGHALRDVTLLKANSQNEPIKDVLAIYSDDYKKLLKTVYDARMKAYNEKRSEIAKIVRAETAVYAAAHGYQPDDSFHDRYVPEWVETNGVLAKEIEAESADAFRKRLATLAAPAGQQKAEMLYDLANHMKEKGSRLAAVRTTKLNAQKMAEAEARATSRRRVRIQCDHQGHRMPVYQCFLGHNGAFGVGAIKLTAGKSTTLYMAQEMVMNPEFGSGEVDLTVTGRFFIQVQMGGAGYLRTTVRIIDESGNVAASDQTTGYGRISLSN